MFTTFVWGHDKSVLVLECVSVGVDNHTRGGTRTRNRMCSRCAWDLGELRSQHTGPHQVGKQRGLQSQLYIPVSCEG